MAMSARTNRFAPVLQEPTPLCTRFSCAAATSPKASGRRLGCTVIINKRALTKHLSLWPMQGSGASACGHAEASPIRQLSNDGRTDMILVTGGAGFIGSNLVAALCDRGAEVVVCDRLGQGEQWRNIAKHAVVEIVDPRVLPAWLDGYGGAIETVFQMGATRSEEHTSELQ